ncbi:MAG: thiamine pyrophosphate-binding protein [Candidatus Thorarchaeota archaeon]
MRDSMKISGGEILAQCLANEEVQYIFGIIGDQWNSFFDVLARKGEQLGIEFVTTRHEAAAAHMADAYARTTRKPGICLGTVGPGAANLVGGVYTAHADSVPLIVLTAQNQRWRIYPDTGMTQGLDQIQLFKPLVKWNAVVWTIDRIPELVRQAFRVALAGRPGPVQLDFPSDILYGTVDSPPLMIPPQKYRVTNQPTSYPTLIGQAAQLLLEAEFPLIHAGTGVLWANASEELVALAEHLSAGVTMSPAARGAIPEDHPLAIEPGLQCGAYAQNCADLVLLVGGRLGDLDFWGKPPGWKPPEKQKLIQIDIESEMIGVNREVDLALVGDAKNTLQFLLSEVKRRSEPKIPSAILEQCQTSRNAFYQSQLKIASEDTEPIHPLRLVKEVRDFFNRTAISCIDGGNINLWTLHLNRIYEPRTHLCASDSGHLGAGLPYAIGAKITHPDRQVYLISGDGSFMFNIQELETAVRHNAPMIAIIANDRRFGMIAGVQHLLFENRYYQVDFTDVRYDKVAQAMGCHGERVTKAKEIRPALKRAVKSKLPAVIDVIIDRDANLNPPELALVGSVWLEGCSPPPVEEEKKEKKTVTEVVAS